MSLVTVFVKYPHCIKYSVPDSEAKTLVAKLARLCNEGKIDSYCVLEGCHAE